MEIVRWFNNPTTLDNIKEPTKNRTINLTKLKLPQEEAFWFLNFMEFFNFELLKKFLRVMLTLELSVRNLNLRSLTEIFSSMFTLSCLIDIFYHNSIQSTYNTMPPTFQQ